MPSINLPQQNQQVTNTYLIGCAKRSVIKLSSHLSPINLKYEIIDRLAWRANVLIAAAANKGVCVSDLKEA